MQLKFKAIAITALLLFHQATIANGKCPFPQKYIEIDRAYHQCVNGHVRNGESCNFFINHISTLFLKYDCKRSFDTSPVPAIWLFDAASEDYIRLIYEMASQRNPIFEGKWFKKEVITAKEVFLSQNFKSILDGHMTEEYYPLIESVRNTP